MKIRLKKMKKFKCSDCGKYIYPGQREDGLPAGVGFRLADGSIINVCSDCIMKRGEEDGKSD